MKVKRGIIINSSPNIVENSNNLFKKGLEKL
jgi:hypothetical protein